MPIDEDLYFELEYVSLGHVVREHSRGCDEVLMDF